MPVTHQLFLAESTQSNELVVDKFRNEILDHAKFFCHFSSHCVPLADSPTGSGIVTFGFTIEAMAASAKARDKEPRAAA